MQSTPNYKIDMPNDPNAPKVEDRLTTQIKIMLEMGLHDKDGVRYSGHALDTSFMIHFPNLRADQFIQLIGAFLFRGMAELEAQTRRPGYRKVDLEHDIRALVDRNLLEADKFLGTYLGDGAITNHPVIPQDE